VGRGEAARWSELLAALEQGMFARASRPEPRATIGAPLLALVEAGAR
jgi:hypothetical protein